MTAGRYTSSTDEEEWNGEVEYATREDAVAGAPEEHDLEPGQCFWVGVIADLEVRAVFPPASFASLVIDEARYDARTEWGDANAERWLDSVTEPQKRDLNERLREAFNAWLEVHGLRPDGFSVRKVTEHTYEGERT